MAKQYRVTLTAEERQERQALLAKGKARARKLAHARVRLPVDETAAPGRTEEETPGDAPHPLYPLSRSKPDQPVLRGPQRRECQFAPCDRAPGGDERLFVADCEAHPVGSSRT
jgi:hypothetical protein